MSHELNRRNIEYTWSVSALRKARKKCLVSRLHRHMKASGGSMYSRNIPARYDIP